MLLRVMSPAMYASPLMGDTQSRGNTVPVPSFANLFIICRCARAGAGMLFTADHYISMFGLSRAEAIPP